MRKEVIFVVAILVLFLGVVSYNGFEGGITGNVVGASCSADYQCSVGEVCNTSVSKCIAGKKMSVNWNNPCQRLVGGVLNDPCNFTVYALVKVEYDGSKLLSQETLFIGTLGNSYSDILFGGSSHSYNIGYSCWTGTCDGSAYGGGKYETYVFPGWTQFSNLDMGVNLPPAGSAGALAVAGIGFPINVLACEPFTCTGLGLECGNWNDGCGAVLDCTADLNSSQCTREVCNATGKVVTENIVGGICGTGGALTCNDSDIGLNLDLRYKTKGNVTLSNGTVFNDSCESSTLIEYSCLSGGGVKATRINCVSGCLDGACLFGDSCIPDWDCDPTWSNGDCGTKECVDKNNCGTTDGRPPTSLPCVDAPGPPDVDPPFTSGGGDGGGLNTGIIIAIAFAVIVLMGLLIFFVLKFSKKKRKKTDWSIKGGSKGPSSRAPPRGPPRGPGSSRPPLPNIPLSGPPLIGRGSVPSLPKKLP